MAAGSGAIGGSIWEAGSSKAELCVATVPEEPAWQAVSRGQSSEAGLGPMWVYRWLAGARQLCGLVGTGQSGTDDGEYVGLMGNRRQQGGAVGGGSEGADVASCFLGSELRVRSRADVAREVAMAGDGDNGGSMVGERQQGGVVHGGNLGGAEAVCSFLEPELQIESRAGGSQSVVGTRQLCGSAGTDQLRNDGRKAKMRKASKRAGSRGAGAAEAVGSRADVGRLGSRFGVLRCDGENGGGAPGVMEKAASGGGGMWWAGMPVVAGASAQCRAIQEAFNRQLEAERRRAPRLAAERRQRWEARWSEQEARKEAAFARRLAEQGQGSKARPTQAGPCAACARHGGRCGFFVWFGLVWFTVLR